MAKKKGITLNNIHSGELHLGQPPQWQQYEGIALNHKPNKKG
jgi:hypothetical protein